MEKTWVGQREGEERREIEEKQDGVGAGPRAGGWGDIRDWRGEEVSLGEGRTPAPRRKGQRRQWLQTDNAGVQNCISLRLRVPRQKSERSPAENGELEWGRGKVRR